MAGLVEQPRAGGQKRALDPFAFFFDQRSALAGLGGRTLASDPRYCFHTAYVPVRPGQAQFILDLSGIETAQAELNVRVMAMRLGHDAMMIASRRLNLERLQGSNASVRLTFSASADIQYALFGFLTEPVEITAKALHVAVREIGPVQREPARQPTLSRFAANAPSQRAGKLFTYRAPRLAKPGSQAFDLAQVSEIRALGLDRELGASGENQLEDALSLWCAALPLQAVADAGMLSNDAVVPAHGLVIDAPDGRLASALAARGCTVAGENDPRPADFAVGYLDVEPASHVGDEWGEDAMQLLDQLVSALADGGLAIAVLRFCARPSDASLYNVIQRIALHVIGHGHGFYQIARAPGPSPCGQDFAGSAFALMARRKIGMDSAAQFDHDRLGVTEHG